MKEIILGAGAATIAIATIMVPSSASATVNFYAGGNRATTHSSYSRIALKDGKIIFEFDSIRCTQSNSVSGGSVNVGNTSVQMPQPTLPAANPKCNPTDVVNNPTPNSTVTIDGVCDEDAAKLKANIKGTNVTVIVNGTGPCDKDDKQPIIIKETVAPSTPNTAETVKQASATTPVADPKAGAGATAELPQTGNSEVIAAVIAAVLAAGAYAGTRAFRAIRG